jgi:muramoyltetrapeptide carboxypeptidase
MIIPPPLKTGDTIGLITPSSPMQDGRLELGIHYLEKKGFKTKVGQYVHKADRFLAGKDEERAQDIMDFFCDPQINAIMATGGGYGSQRILPFLDMKKIKANPKWLVGFSDTTALQLGILSQAGIASCTGFTFRDLEKPILDPFVEKTLMTCLMRQFFEINEGVSIVPGIVQGSLIGGNLDCLCALIGTPYQPNFKKSILLIEEVWAEPYKIDGMLSQLELAGIFHDVAGIIWGSFEQCDAHHFSDRDGTVNDIISEWSRRIAVPSIKDFPYGHQNRRCVLPLGGEVLLDAENVILKIIPEHTP